MKYTSIREAGDEIDKKIINKINFDNITFPPDVKL